MLNRRSSLLALFSVAAATTSLPALAASAPVYTGLFSKLAVAGHDPVAYFTDGKPVKGSADFQLTHQGVQWRFASAANLERFKADPAAYAPQYGGYCAWAAAQGSLAPGDPKYWKIVDKKLYLNFDADVQKKWEAGIPGFISRADSLWPKLLDQ